MMSNFTGACLCGEITYAINRTHLNAMHCYCGMCRSAHGGAFSTHVIVRPNQLEWLSQTVRGVYESSPQAYREFCTNCGTHMLIHGQSGDDTLAIPAGTLHGDPEITILGHMFVSEQVSWYKIADTLPQHSAWPAGFGPS